MSYSYPEDYLRWFTDGDRLALVTSKNTSSKNILESIDESQTDGLLIEYTAEPTPITDLSDVPEIEDSLHLAIVNYIKWKLWEDQAGQEAAYEAAKYKGMYYRQVRKEAARSKTGGSVTFVPYKIT